MEADLQIRGTYSYAASGIMAPRAAYAFRDPHRQRHHRRTPPRTHPRPHPRLPTPHDPEVTTDEPTTVGSPVRDVLRHHTGGPRGTRTHNPRIKSLTAGAAQLVLRSKPWSIGCLPCLMRHVSIVIHGQSHGRPRGPKQSLARSSCERVRATRPEARTTSNSRCNHLLSTGALTTRGCMSPRRTRGRPR